VGDGDHICVCVSEMVGGGREKYSDGMGGAARLRAQAATMGQTSQPKGPAGRSCPARYRPALQLLQLLRLRQIATKARK
jgi:hypothetical protein